MQLEHYFKLFSSISIRVEGTRMKIEHILYHYIYDLKPPEGIVSRISSITLKQVHAAILYHLHDSEALENSWQSG